MNPPRILYKSPTVLTAVGCPFTWLICIGMWIKPIFLGMLNSNSTILRNAIFWVSLLVFFPCGSCAEILIVFIPSSCSFSSWMRTFADYILFSDRFSESFIGLLAVESNSEISAITKSPDRLPSTCITNN